jgi:hypothetical protein
MTGVTSTELPVSVGETEAEAVTPVLSNEELRRMDAYWRACDCLAAGTTCDQGIEKSEIGQWTWPF